MHGYDPAIDDFNFGTRDYSLDVQVDGNEPETSIQQLRGYPTWTILMPGMHFGNYACPFELKAGRHTVKFRGHGSTKMQYDGVVATRMCGAFEPR